MDWQSVLDLLGIIGGVFSFMWLFLAIWRWIDGATQEAIDHMRDTIQQIHDAGYKQGYKDALDKKEAES